MTVKVIYEDSTYNEYECVNEIYKIDSDLTPTKLNPKQDIITRQNIYQLIGNNINCTLDLYNKTIRSVTVEF